MQKNEKERVVVAMSGGVDSSVAALLMKEQGYEVIGISMRLYESSAEVEHGCCTPQDLYDARKVADHLGIPHYVCNYETTFEKTVISDFISSYRKGETPNPCVRCNQDVKFSALRHRAKELGARYLVTGHYARREQVGETYRLFRALDRRRDQSYFLFGMSQEELRDTLFPLGKLQKSEVRELARNHGLPVADKADSQEICFVPENYADFLKHRLSPEDVTPGEIIDERGDVVGRHSGVHQFTVGQRKGLNVSSSVPKYVLAVHPSGQVRIGPKEELLERTFQVRDVRWVNDVPSTDVVVHAQIRSRFEPRPARISILDDHRVDVEFHDPQSAITPGQAAVFYKDYECLGGGWIQRSSFQNR